MKGAIYLYTRTGDLVRIVGRLRQTTRRGRGRSAYALVGELVEEAERPDESSLRSFRISSSKATKFITALLNEEIEGPVILKPEDEASYRVLCPGSLYERLVAKARELDLLIE
ncbi:MAG: hypothetical protein ABWK00_05070 [Desulfurococcaceae archaeon]